MEQHSTTQIRVNLINSAFSLMNNSAKLDFSLLPIDIVFTKVKFSNFINKKAMLAQNSHSSFTHMPQMHMPQTSSI